MFLRTTPEEGGYNNNITNFSNRKLALTISLSCACMLSTQSSCEGEMYKELNNLKNSLRIGQPCYLTNISLNFLIVCLVSDDIRENSSLDLNKFVCDELQPNEVFHRLCKDAVDSLYRKIQTDLPGTDEGDKIHNLIKVGGQTAPIPSPEKWVVKKDAREKVSL